MNKKLAICVMFLLFGQTIFASEKVGLGFEFGTSFYRFSKGNFGSGGGNYFHLKISGEEDVKYFLNNESGNISANVGDAVTGLTVNITGVGASMKLSDSLRFSLMTGSATIIGAAGAGTGTNAISATQSTAPIADISLIWSKISGNSSLNIGGSYRYHSLSNPITFTDSAGKTDRVTDMSALNVNLGIGYAF